MIDTEMSRKNDFKTDSEGTFAMRYLQLIKT